ncbi:MAG: hypothetical protein U1D69_09200 [Polynucleobacter sp.]|nr:hypothetical protein [Polynucleobacter sp.]
MSKIKINIGGAGGQMGKFTPLPRLGGALYAGYLLGSDFHTLAAFGGGGVDDLSGNGRSLTETGGVYAANHMVCTPSNFLQAPFTDTTLFGSQGCTMIAVSASGFAEASIDVGTFSNPASGTRGIALGTPTDSNLPLVSYNFSGGPQVNLTATPARDANVFEFRAGTFSPAGGLVYRRRSDVVGAQTNATTTAQSILVGQSVRIGQPNLGTTFDGTVKVAAAFFANRVLTVGELDDAYTETKALLAQFGLSI